MSEDTILVGTADAARVLNIAERTVRKHIAAEKLTAHRINGAWLVELPRDQVAAAGIEIPETDQLVDAEGAERPLLASTRTAGGPAEPPATVDLAPMAAVIADLTRQVAALSESSAMWQERSRTLEEQNREIRLALTAGETKIDEAEVQRRVDEAVAEAKEQGRAEALAMIDRRPWWQKLFG